MKVPVKVFVGDTGGFNWCWLDSEQEENFDGTDTAVAVMDAILERIESEIIGKGTSVFTVDV